MLEIVARIMQHRDNAPPTVVATAGAVMFDEHKINNQSTVTAAQRLVTDLLKFSAGKPELDEILPIKPIAPSAATDILASVAAGVSEISAAFASDQYITIIIKNVAATHDTPGTLPTTH